MAKAVLDLIEQNTVLVSYELQGDEVSIGRSRENSISVGNRSISRHHALIRRTEAGYNIRDLDSANGVYVNDEKIEEISLKDGDTIELGAVAFVFRLKEAQEQVIKVAAEPAVFADTVEMPAGLGDTVPTRTGGGEPDEARAEAEAPEALQETRAAAESASPPPQPTAALEVPPSDLHAELELLDRDRHFFILKLHGQLDAATEDKLARILNNIFAAGGVNLVVSLDDVTVVSERAWGMLAHRNASLGREGNSLVVVMPPSQTIVSPDPASAAPGLSVVKSSADAVTVLAQAPSSPPAGPGPERRDIDGAPEAPTHRSGMDIPRALSQAAAPPSPATARPRSLDPETLVMEEIRKTVAENPTVSIGRIRKELRDPEHGEIRLTRAKLKDYLKRLDLDTAKKRRMME